jgi:hypothetical protein
MKIQICLNTIIIIFCLNVTQSTKQNFPQYDNTNNYLQPIQYSQQYMPNPFYSNFPGLYSAQFPQIPINQVQPTQQVKQSTNNILIDPNVKYDIVVDKNRINGSRLEITNPNEIFAQIMKGANQVVSNKGTNQSDLNNLLSNDEAQQARSDYINNIFNKNSNTVQNNENKVDTKQNVESRYEKDVINDIIAKSKAMDNAPAFASNFGNMNIATDVNTNGNQQTSPKNIANNNSASQIQTEQNKAGQNLTNNQEAASKLYNDLLDLMKQQNNDKTGLSSTSVPSQKFPVMNNNVTQEQNQSKTEESNGIPEVEEQRPKLELKHKLEESTQKQEPQTNPDENLFKNFLATFH